jgi:hypothetical protein
MGKRRVNTAKKVKRTAKRKCACKRKKVQKKTQKGGFFFIPDLNNVQRKLESFAKIAAPHLKLAKQQHDEYYKRLQQQQQQ